MSSSDYQRVESAIRYLDHHMTRQPSLDQVAEHVGLSKYHLHRLFTRWAGVTPKRFLQFLTVEHAKERLRRSESVLSATYSAGLSGPGRLHDQFVAVEAVTPGEYKSGGTGLEIRHGVADSPFGTVFVARTPRGLCRLVFLGESEPTTELDALRRDWWGARLVESPDVAESVSREVFGAPFSDDPVPITLHLRGTNFQVRVWRALLRVPVGSLTTYGALAAASGHPGAARAVGTAVGRNDLAFVIPCHRVIRSMGGVGGYRWGTPRKRSILAWEASKLAGPAAATDLGTGDRALAAAG